MIRQAAAAADGAVILPRRAEPGARRQVIRSRGTARAIAASAVARAKERWRNLSMADSPDNTRPVTRADVARAANTSTATVSYVINDGPKAVAPDTRARVLRAIDDLGYRPNLIARSLRSAHTQTIGMIVPQIENPFFAGLVAAIEEEAAAHGKMVLFGTTGYNVDTERSLLDGFADRRVDAIFAIGPSQELRSYTRRRHGALVVIDRTSRGIVVSVGINQRQAARTATEHLIEHGYETIACIAGRLYPSKTIQSVTSSRVRGWREALRKHGLPDDAALLRRADFAIGAGYEAAMDLFGGPGRPRAVFVSSDVQTIGVLNALHDLGLHVPDDVALFSFDGTRLSQYLVPPVSAIRQPIQTMAATAMDVLERGNETATDITVPFEVLLRESCGCGPADDHTLGAN